MGGRRERARRRRHRARADHRGASGRVSGDVRRSGTRGARRPASAFHARADKRALPTVGDWVAARALVGGARRSRRAVIREILPRRSLLVRKAAGEASVPQPLAANVDLGLVMTSANSELSPPRLDRYLDLLRDGGIPRGDRAVEDRSRRRAAAARRAGHDDAPDVPGRAAVDRSPATGLDELRALVRPRMTARAARQLRRRQVDAAERAARRGRRRRRSEIRDDERGRHTTTRRELFVASDGSLWIDTPGMRELAPLGRRGRRGRRRRVRRHRTRSRETASSATACTSREPGCAVLEAVVKGELELDRVASFHKLAERAHRRGGRSEDRSPDRRDPQGEGQALRAAPRQTRRRRAMSAISRA